MKLLELSYMTRRNVFSSIFAAISVGVATMFGKAEAKRHIPDSLTAKNLVWRKMTVADMEKWEIEQKYLLHSIKHNMVFMQWQQKNYETNKT